MFLGACCMLHPYRTSCQCYDPQTSSLSDLAHHRSLQRQSTPIHSYYFTPYLLISSPSLFPTSFRQILGSLHLFSCLFCRSLEHLLKGSYHVTMSVWCGDDLSNYSQGLPGPRLPNSLGFVRPGLSNHLITDHDDDGAEPRSPADIFFDTCVLLGNALLGLSRRCCG